MRHQQIRLRTHETSQETSQWISITARLNNGGIVGNRKPFHCCSTTQSMYAALKTKERVRLASIDLKFYGLRALELQVPIFCIIKPTSVEFRVLDSSMRLHSMYKSIAWSIRLGVK